MDSKLNNSIPSLLCLCIDRVAEGEFYGRLFDRWHGEAQSVAGSADFLQKAQHLFNRLGYPQADTHARRFGGEGEPFPIAGGGGLTLCRDAAELWAQRGEKGTFVIGVTGRACATWQGRAAWIENKSVTDFESELELLRKILAAIKEP